MAELPIEKRPDGRIVIVGSKVSAVNLLGWLCGNSTIRDILEHHPDVERARIEDFVRGCVWSLMDRARSVYLVKPRPKCFDEEGDQVEGTHVQGEIVVAAEQWTDEMLVTSDPDIRSGDPCFAWTRTRAQELIDGLLAGRAVGAFSGSMPTDVTVQMAGRVLRAGYGLLTKTMEMPSADRDEYGRLRG